MNFLKKNLVILGLVFLLSALWIVNYVFFSPETARKSKAEGESVTMSFSPASVTASSGADFTLTVKATPSAQMAIRGYIVRINFDKAKVQVKDIQYKLGSVSAGLGDDNSKLSAVNEKGFIKIMGEIQTSAGQVLSTAITDIASITFTSRSSEESTIVTDSGVSKFYKINQDSSISEIPVIQGEFSVNDDGTAGTPTVTTSPSGNVTLNLKLKFQGILKKTATDTMNVKVKLGGASSNTDYQTGRFIVDDNGVWSGTVSFNTAPGSGYIVYVKGPKHLQKKICAATPTETSPGMYNCSTANLTLTTGENTFDLSGILLFAGDIYGPDKTQDGIINSVDLSFVKNNLNKTDAETLAVCDINLDGKCDTQDYSLIIFALSVKTDEQ